MTTLKNQPYLDPLGRVVLALTRNKWPFLHTHTSNARSFDEDRGHHLLCVTNNFQSLRLINSKQVACVGKWQLGSQRGVILSL